MNYIINFLKYLRYFGYRYFIHHYLKPVYIYLESEIKNPFSLDESFFGYYNLSPEDQMGNILCLKTNRARADIFVYKRIESKIFKIDSTLAHNWQQGCMLQWSPLKDNVVYFNDYDANNKEYFSKIININNSDNSRIIPKPLCCISADETFALSLNFDRLAIMRPDYGYKCKESIKLPSNDCDGIWKIDLKTGTIKLIITLSQLIDLQPVDSMRDANHKVNHIDIAPNSNRFIFLHRWVGPQGRFMRLISADNEGKSIFILNGDYMTSHSCWYGNDHIISFCFTPEYGNGYTVFTDLKRDRRLLSTVLPRVDGHPSVSPDGKWMVTDSYPNHDRMSKMYLYNFILDELVVLGRFYQPLKYVNENRIDLHPKWNKKGDRIYFESGHNGRRNLYYINLTKIVCE